MASWLISEIFGHQDQDSDCNHVLGPGEAMPRVLGQFWTSHNQKDPAVLECAQRRATELGTP